MKDRVPTYPGRVTLTPVAGQTNTYDMVRADAPVEAGTPLNKANLMPDTLATKLGLDAATATPALGIEKVFDKAAAAVQGVIGSYSGTGTTSRTITLGFKPSFLIISGGSTNVVSASDVKSYSADSGVFPFVQISQAVNTTSITFSATGFTVSGANAEKAFNGTGGVFKYLALR